MRNVKIGLRRLYDAMGCSISCQEEWTASFPIDCYSAVVYIGANPKFGIAYNQIQTPKYQIPGEATPMMVFEYKKVPSESTYPRKFFTEIAVFEEAEISEEMFAPFSQGDSKAVDLILNKAAEHENQLKKMVDVIAGTIGLRFHCQFVMKIISEIYLAFKNEEDWGFRIASPAIQLLESIGLNPTGLEILDQLLPGIGKSSSEALNFGAKALEWLLKSWIEHEPITKFTYLFIALEIVLGNVSKTDELPSENALRIKSFIETSCGDTKDDDLRYFEKALRSLERQPLSLANRFEILAEEAKMAGWENDILAFRKFNRFRNNLIHGGDSNLDLEVTVSEDEIRQLEDLAERYVSWALFRDGLVYKSQFRPEVR
jgi:hypothetical protein